jgi:REP-associated tyrosine transposase
MAQLELPPRGLGGRRPGAGRPRSRKSGVPHLRREKFRKLPVHITLKVLDVVGDLRTDKRFARIQRAFFAACDHLDMRILQFSVQGNHIHLVVEAADHKALSTAMQGLCIRLAKGINRISGRGGTVFADRYHAHVLKTPSEVRNAVHYVFNNQRKHRRERGILTHPWDLDGYSSAFGEACWYIGDGGEAAMVIVEPVTWLGWHSAAVDLRLRPPEGHPASTEARARRRPARVSAGAARTRSAPRR